MVDEHLLVGLARSRPRQEVTAPSPEEVQLVADLLALVEMITLHGEAVMTGEPYDWAAVVDALGEAYEAAVRQVMYAIEQQE